MPMLGAAFLMGGTALVDQSMAAMLSGGSVAALSYASKVISVVMAIGSLALSTAALPYFSQMAARGDWYGCRHTLKRYTVLVFVVTVPSTFLLIFFSQPLVKILFQRGAFTSADTELVSRVQIYYSIQIPFYILGALFLRFLSAAKRNDAIMYISAISLVADVVLHLVLMRIWGVAGIALSTSLVYVLAFALLAFCSIRIFEGNASRMATVAVKQAN